MSFARIIHPFQLLILDSLVSSAVFDVSSSSSKESLLLMSSTCCSTSEPMVFVVNDCSMSFLSLNACTALVCSLSLLGLVLFNVGRNESASFYG